MNAENPKTLLRFTVGAIAAFRRGRLSTFLIGPVLLEPFLRPIYEAFREEHKRFMQEYFSEEAKEAKNNGSKAEASGPEFLH